MELTNQQVAVITGAGSGIGEALAHECAKYGMRIVAADIELDAAQNTVSNLKEKGTEAVAVETDVANKDSVFALAETTWDVYGACHLLCNNAGVSVNRALIDCTEADWNWVMSVNVMGAASAVSAFVPRMIQQGEKAHIVNTASMAGLIPLADFGPYVASKYAMVGFSEVLSQELAAHDIGVSILCPGVVNTRIFESHRNRQDAHVGNPVADDNHKTDMSTNFDDSLTRMMTPQEVAAITLEAVRSSTLYVATHPEWLASVKQRFETIEKAFRH